MRGQSGGVLTAVGKVRGFVGIDRWDGQTVLGCLKKQKCGECKPKFRFLIKLEFFKKQKHVV